jgi:hypothetical protein
MKDALLGIARHILTAGGGYLVAKGTIDAVGAEQLVGALITILGVVASVIDKKDRA